MEWVWVPSAARSPGRLSGSPAVGDNEMDETKAPGLDVLVDQAEVNELERRFGPGRRWHFVVEMGEANFRYWWGKIVRKANRRGEVVFAIRRPDGDVLVHTKSIYPFDVYRLPSGGIFPGESVIDGLSREVREETGLTLDADRYLGLITYEFRYRGISLYFVSYVFLLRADDSTPRPEDEGEAISDMRYVPAATIGTVAGDLRQLPEGWADWGEFRAPAHDMVFQALEEDRTQLG